MAGKSETNWKWGWGKQKRRIWAARRGLIQNRSWPNIASPDSGRARYKSKGAE